MEHIPSSTLAKPMQGMASLDYTYATVDVKLTPDGQHYPIILDSGSGMSLVGAEFLAKYYPKVKYRPRKVATHGEVCAFSGFVKYYVTLDLYFEGTLDKGQSATAHFQGEFCVVPELEHLNILLGIDLWYPQKIGLDVYGQRMIIGSCRNISIPVQVLSWHEKKSKTDPDQPSSPLTGQKFSAEERGRLYREIERQIGRKAGQIVIDLTDNTPCEDEDPTTSTSPVPQHQDPINILANELAELYSYNFKSRTFKFKTDVTATVSTTGKWKYQLQIIGRNMSFCQEIMADINPTFKSDQFAFIFYQIAEHTVLGWLLRFKESATMTRFEDGLLQALWEQTYREKWSEAKDLELEGHIEKIVNVMGAEEVALDVEGQGRGKIEAGSLRRKPRRFFGRSLSV